MKPIITNLKHAVEVIWKRQRAVGFVLGGSLIILGIARVLWNFPAWGLPCAIVNVGVLLVILLWQFPKWQVSSVAGLEAKERFDRENEARRTLSQIVGGLALLIGFYFTWQNLELTKRNQAEADKATQENLRIASEGQITDRFTKAIAQLGDTKLEVRLGGSYALERVAKDSPKDEWSIMEVLTAYIREHAKKNQVPPKPASDIQAILTIIGRRALTYRKGEDQRLDLHEADLRGAYLDGADLRGAALDGADLGGAALDGADLGGAALDGADLGGAALDGADLGGADLDGADLGGADLDGADLGGADLDGADLGGADLGGADLRGADGLPQSHLDSTYGDDTTKIPAYLHRPKQWQ